MYLIRFRFGTIISLKQQNNDVVAHILWFHHSSKTSLKEFGHPEELMVVDRCDTVSVQTFVSRLDVIKLAPDEEEPPPSEDGIQFFYR